MKINPGIFASARQRPPIGGGKEPNTMRKTKIICTLGPASSNTDTLRTLLRSGMDAARFNFSHGTHASHLALLNTLREACAAEGITVATILDTKGPEIRIGTFENGPITLNAGDSFTLTPRDVPGSASKVSITYANLAGDLHIGDRILVDDGLIELQVANLSGGDILCTVLTGGPLSNNKSINIPDVRISLPGLTSRDRSDIKFAVEQDFDYIAVSFVRSAADILAVRELLRSFGNTDIRLIAKIENREGVNHLREIIDAADGIMVARGDLGVEVPMEEIPHLQKEMIRQGVIAGKPVIVATQMLDSMIRNPRPTRAEVSDVANAVYDYASCVMLSGETASGKYPAEALLTMARTVEEAERHINYEKRFREEAFSVEGSVTNAVSLAGCAAAFDLKADAIISVTHSGSTARMLSRFKPSCPICAATVSEKVCRQLRLSWGIYPTLAGVAGSTDELFRGAVESCKRANLVKSGDLVVFTAGVPIGRSGTTNLLKIEVV